MEHWDEPGPRANRRAETALKDYLQQGPGRSLETLLVRYQTQASAPTRQAATLSEWAARYNWHQRAASFDEQQRANARRAEAEHSAEVLGAGLALTIERVENLKRLYDQLDGYLRQAWPVWLADLQHGALELAGQERSRAPRFNTSVIIQMRGLLEDLARETGGRQTRAQAAGQNTAELDENSFPDLRSLSSEQLDAIDCILLGDAKPEPCSTWQPGLPGFVE